MILNLPYDLLYKVVDHSLVNLSVKKNLCATCDHIRNLVYKIIAERADLLYNKCNLWIHYNKLDIFTLCTQPNATLINILKKINIYRSGLKCHILCDYRKLLVNLNFDISSLAMKFSKNRQLMICITKKKKKTK